MHNYNVSQEFIKAAMLGDGVVHKLERRFEAFLDNRLHCLSVMNATSGLAAVLRCFRPGIVIAPLFTSPATWAAIEHAGHQAVFCDIDPVSVCLSPAAVKRHVETGGPEFLDNLRAIVAVNIFGHLSDLESLSKLAHQLRTALIVDAAQSLATCFKNVSSISLADVLVFSLGPNKWLGCADGGIIAVKSKELWTNSVRLTQPVERQMLDVPCKPTNPLYYNFRINPYTASQARAALNDIVQRIEMCRKQQSAIVTSLLGCEAIEPLPDKNQLVFEPLTAIPLKQADGYFFHELPLPVPANLDGLPETRRQFLYRKVIRRKSFVQSSSGDSTL